MSPAVSRRTLPAAARQNAFDSDEQVEVIRREAVRILCRQDTIRTPFHQRREVVGRERLPSGIAR